MQSPPFPRYLVPPRSKYSPQHRVLFSNTLSFHSSRSVNDQDMIKFRDDYVFLSVMCTAQFRKYSVVSMFTFSVVKIVQKKIIFWLKYSIVLSYEGTVMFRTCIKKFGLCHFMIFQEQEYADTKGKPVTV